MGVISRSRRSVCGRLGCVCAPAAQAAHEGRGSRNGCRERPRCTGGEPSPATDPRISAEKSVRNGNDESTCQHWRSGRRAVTQQWHQALSSWYGDSSRPCRRETQALHPIGHAQEPDWPNQRTMAAMRPPTHPRPVGRARRSVGRARRPSCRRSRVSPAGCPARWWLPAASQSRS